MKFPHIFRRKKRVSHPSKWRKSFAIIAGLVLLAAGPTAYVLLRTPSNAQAAWFDNSWAFRQKVPITNSSGSTQTGFQVQLSIDTATLITAGKLQSNCQDVRITNNSSKQLPFWIEPNTCNTSATKVWAKVDTIPTTTSGTSADIYFYYGNATATAANYSVNNVFMRDITGDAAVWPLDETNASQSYSNVYNPAVTTGRNIIVNGTFDDTSQWTSVAGFSISGGTANFSSGSTLTGDGATFNLVTPNKMYAITYTVSNYSAGTIRTRAGSGSSGAGTARSANGTYTDTVQASTGTSQIYLDPTGFTGSVDNVSAVELNLPASGSSLTQLVTDGNMETSGTAAWAAGNAATLTKQTTNPHAGTQLLRVAYNGSPLAQATQTVFTTGQTYRITGYARSDGTAIPAVNGLTNVFTGSSSTSWQPFDVSYVAGDTTLRLRNNTSSGYVEFDDVTVSLDTTLRSGEISQDGGLETWSNATTLTNWTSTLAGTSTVNREASVTHSGSFAARLDIDGSNSNADIRSNLTLVGRRYLVTFWAKSEAASGVSMSVAGTADYLSNQALTSTYTQYSTTFTSDNTALVFKRGTGASSHSIYIDDISVTEVSPMVGLPANGVTLGSTANGHLTNAYTFDGTNDAVNINSADLNSAFNPSEGSLSLWIKPSGSGIWTDATNRYPIYLGVDGSNVVYIAKTSTNNTLQMYYGAGSGVSAVSTTSLGGTTGWAHLVLTWSKSNDQVKGYVNGAQISTTQTGLGTWVGNLASTHAIIGATSTAGANSWSGLINDVHLYSRALTPQEVSDLYGTGSTDRQAYYTDNYSGHELIRSYSSGVTVGTFATEEVGTSPAGWWKFNEGNGQSVQDSTANKTNGTLGANSSSASDDPTWVTDDQCVSGKCLKFDGTNDLVNVGDVTSTRLGNTGSAEAWVKPNAYPGAATWSVILNKGNWGSGRNMYAIYYQQSTSALRFDIGGPSASNAISVANTLTPLNTWSHVAMTWDGTTVRAYINGQQVGTIAQTVTPDTSTYALQFGSANTARYLQGFIDEPKIFSYARTAAQIQVDYSAGAATMGLQSQGALSTGLVGYWKMDESSWTVDCTTSSVLDSSGNGYNGQSCPTSTGPTGGVLGKFGNAGLFDGSNDYVNVNDATPLNPGTSDFTVSFWTNPSTVTSGASFLGKGFAGNGPGYGFRISSTSPTFWMADGTNVTEISNSQTLTAGNWYHIVGVRKNNVMSLYVNGVVGATTGNAAYNVTVNGGQAALSFGARSGGGTGLYNGKLDDIRIYSRALSAGEVRQLYNYAPGPVGEWRFEEGTGSSVADTSGNGSTGTWNGTLGNQWIQGKYGKGGLFNGSDNYVNVSTTNFPNPTNAITLESWVYITAHKNWNNFIFRDGWFTNGKTAFDFYSDSSGIARFGISTSSSTSYEAVTPALSTGTWYHLAGTYDGSNLRMYVNGVLQSTTAASNLTFSSISTLTLSDAASNKLNGKLDDVKIYNYARSASQIQEDMRGTALSTGALSTVAGPATSGKPSSPVAYWKFDEGYGTTANNYGSANNAIVGTLTNMASPATSTSGWTNSGKVNKAITLDGTNDYVTIPSSANLSPGTGGFSVSAWIKTSANYSGAVGWIFSNYGSTTTNVFGVDVSTANKLSCLVRDGSSNIVQPSPGGPVLNDGVWHHVTCTYNAGTLNMYVDGKLTGTATNTSVGTVDTTGLAKTIGTIATSTGVQNFTGQIDEVKVYSFALTPDQVNADFNQNLSQNFGVTETKEAANDLTDGAGNEPIGYWPFDEKTGTTANDKSGNNRAATLTNFNFDTTSGWVPGKINSALHYDGTNDIAQVANSAYSVVGSGDFTINAWVKPDSISSSVNARILTYKQDATNGYHLAVISSASGTCASRFIFEVEKAGTYYASGCSTSNAAAVANTWYHLTGVFNGTTNTATLYINGIPQVAGVTQSLGLGVTTTLTWASQSTGGSNLFSGMIDETKVYDYARSQSQITYDYNRGAPVGWWKMDECQGSTINDSSGFGSTGTLTVAASGSQTLAGTCNTASTAWGNGATGKYNASLNFDGSDDYVSIPNPSVDDFGTGPMSVSAWVKTTSTALEQVIDNKIAGSNAAGFNLGINVAAGNGRVMWRVANGSTQATTGTTTADSVVNDGNWHHLVGVYFRGASNDSLLLYKDGKLVQSNTTITAGWNITSSTNLFLGSWGSTAGNGNFDGQIDDIRLFNYALSQNQVNKLYNENVSVLYGPVTGSP